MTATMKKRLSMTGAVEECEEAPHEGKDATESGHSRDNTVSEDGSQSSVNAEVEKSPCEEAAVDNTPGKGSSSRRRRSLFGNSGGGREDSVERTDVDNANKPSSRRRRSLFGSATSDVAADLLSPQKPQARRRSLFGSSTPATADGAPYELDDPSERSESTTSSRPPSGARRNMFGSPTPTLDETIGRMPPRPNKSGISIQSGASESSHSTRHSLASASEVPPRDNRNRGVDRAKSMQSPLTKEKKKVNRGNGLAGAWSFHSGDSGKASRANGLAGSPEKTSIDNVPPSPSTPQGTSRSTFRRLSLGNLLSGYSSGNEGEETPRSKSRRLSLGNLLSGSTSVIEGEETPKAAKSSRRASLAGASPGTPSDNDNHKSREGGLIRMPRRSSTGGAAGPPARVRSAPMTPKAATAPIIVNPYELVNKAREKKGLPQFSRNMLMDTLAKQVALDLSASFGTKCTPTSYHGNVGQGESIETIHRTMIKQKEGVARANILSAQFSEIGIGIARCKDGSIYMCQLFN